MEPKPKFTFLENVIILPYKYNSYSKLKKGLESGNVTTNKNLTLDGKIVN